jgi:hypothetical protein
VHIWHRPLILGGRAVRGLLLSRYGWLSLAVHTIRQSWFVTDSLAVAAQTNCSSAHSSKWAQFLAELVWDQQEDIKFPALLVATSPFSGPQHAPQTYFLTFAFTILRPRLTGTAGTASALAGVDVADVDAVTAREPEVCSVAAVVAQNFSTARFC